MIMLLLAITYVVVHYCIVEPLYNGHHWELNLALIENWPYIRGGFVLNEHNWDLASILGVVLMRGSTVHAMSKDSQA